MAFANWTAASDFSLKTKIPETGPGIFQTMCRYETEIPYSYQ